MDAPLVKVPADIAGVRLIAELGIAYECEEEYLCSWLVRQGGELRAAVEEAELDREPGVSRFLAALKSAIDFLESVPDETVAIYSYDRPPTTDDLLDAFAKGNGADDWAIQELAKKSDKGRKALLSVLKKEKNKDRLLAAVSMLLIVFRDDQTVAAIRRIVDTCEDDTGREAAVLLAAYTSG